LRNFLKGFVYCITVFVFLILHQPLFAQQDSGPEKKHFLWSVKSNSNTVYILGSLHLLSKDSYPLGQAYEEAYGDSEVVVFEVDPGELDKPETIKMVLSKATLEKGKTLQETVSPQTYEQAKEELKELGVDINMFTNTKPWFVAVTATILKLSKMGFNPEYGVDQYYYNKAKDSSKEVRGLETAEFQIDLIASLGEDTEDEVLLHTLRDLDVIELELGSLIDSWNRGDEGEFQELILRSYAEYPRVYDKLIVSRNKKWLKEIESYLRGDKNYLVVVGAGHLVGEDGLIKLLSDKGYKIEQK
jgi:uncharacterized protein